MTTLEMPNEFNMVEQPLIAQLQSLGWVYLTGDTDVPELSERASFREVLLKDRLRAAIQRINLGDDGEPWLDDERIEQAIGDLERLGAVKLMEANQTAFGLLRDGTTVPGDDVLHKGKDQTVRFIDFDHPERNEFLVINQFRVDGSAGQPTIIPDIVCIVNGIPLVVIECKNPALQSSSPEILGPMDEAITQLLRYSNQRDWVDGDEGVERLFHYNAFMVGTTFYEALAATVGAGPEHFLAWKDTNPVPMGEVATALGVEKLSAQQALVAGMLRPKHLLDLLRNFTVYETESGRTIKKLARYQQFRAVHRALERLQHGPTRAQHGDMDGRGGVIWHTQGSGKSLSMVFLIRKMRTLPGLKSFKVAIVTDRTDLEKQLAATAALTGDTVLVARSEARLQTLLREAGPALIFGMIQKMRSPEEDDPIAEAPVVRQPSLRRVAETIPPYDDQPKPTIDYPVLNDSERILVLVDEAHRSHGRDLHMNLRSALPNAAMIGFTGTPIIMGDRTQTQAIFGPFIDTYTIRQSEEDGSTVPIIYEGRTTDGEVAGGGSLDQLFEDMFRERTPEEIEAIKRKYATTGNVLEAPAMIEAKAADMVRHYIDVVLPNGFKAQVVATSRLAAVRYQAAIAATLAKLVEHLAGLDPTLLSLDDAAREALDPESQYLLRAHPYLATIRRLEAATVVSAGGVNQPHWPEWSDKPRQDSSIARFKKPLVHDDPSKHDGLAFLCVKSMLLTGFDAPLEQVLYLDRAMGGHELLQAIARVNRTAPRKTHGLVVDYFGVGRHLTDALAVYTQDDVVGVLTNIKDELPKLADRHQRVLDFFRSRGIPDIRDVHACVDLLRDQKLRAEFTAKLEVFLDTLDRVMPRPEARPYLNDAKLLGFINKATANLYRSEQMSLVGVGEKVRRLIDDHIRASGVDPKIPPISITDAEFVRVVEGHVSPKAKASEMEHAARKHIRVNMGQDPAYYRKLSERLEAILQQFQDNWEELVKALKGFTDEVRGGPPGDDTGLDPRIQAPFLRLLIEADGGAKPDPVRLRALIEATIEIVDHIRQEIRVVDFWRNQHLQGALRQWILEDLDRRNILPFRQLPVVADEIVQLARHRHTELTA